MFHPNRIINAISKVLFLIIDFLWFRKDPTLWVIAIPHTDRFDGNVRAIYELYRNDESLCSPAQIKVILTPKDQSSVCRNDFVRWGSLKHFTTVLRSGCIIFHHNFNDVGLIASPLWRKNFRVSHGIHFKSVERAQSVPGFIGRHFLSMKNTIPHHLVSSRLDAMSAVAYFHLYLPEILVTGSAKNDILVQNDLTGYYKGQEATLMNLLNGRKLITYAPTWRNSGKSYRLTSTDIDTLKNFLNTRNLVFGFAGHPYLSERYVPEQPEFIDLNSFNIDVQVVLRNTHILVTDYSSIWIDFLLTNRPTILFQYDSEDYMRSRSFLFDTKLISPSLKVYDFPSLLNALADVSFISNNNKGLLGSAEKNTFLRNVFHKFQDGRNGIRTIEAIKNISNIL